MKVVELLIRRQFNQKLKVLDIPAGNGVLSDTLRRQGHVVTSADFNKERQDFDYVNMECSLPYLDKTFDLVICLEGIEHIVEPYFFVKELSRITKPDGAVIISMPNVQSIYSRLQFLFTGTFYQFEPWFSRNTNGYPVDRGHVSSLSLVQLDYFFNEQGMSLKVVSCDHVKRAILFPLYFFILLINKLHSAICAKRYKKNIYNFIKLNKAMLGRSIIALWVK